MPDDPIPDPAPDPMPTPDPTPDPTRDPTPDPDGLGDAGKEVLKRERAALREAEKQLKAANVRLREAEDKDKSELEKAAERAREAEARAAKAEARQLRIDIAVRKKLPLEMADRLIGDDRDALEKDADKLLKSVVPATGSLDQGPRGPNSPKPKSMNDFLRDGLVRQ